MVLTRTSAVAVSTGSGPGFESSIAIWAYISERDTVGAALLVREQRDSRTMILSEKMAQWHNGTMGMEQ